MQILVTDTATKAKLQETLQKRRNLFGLGVTSLIAACSGADGAGGGNDDSAFTSTLDFKAEKAEKLLEPKDDFAEAKALAAAQANDYSADKSSTGGLTVTVKQGTDTEATLVFSEAINTNTLQPNSVNIHKLTTADNQYDLVISSPTINKDTGHEDKAKGKIFIYWDVATVTDSKTPDLEIKGATTEDKIGIHAPAFLQIAGTDNKYDMVIRSHAVDRSKGAIYILWDIADYKTTASITLDAVGTGVRDSGLLTIKGETTTDLIGTHAPDFLQIGGGNGEEKLDMVIRSHGLDRGKGAIYILWDVDSYWGSKTAITLDGGNTNIDDSGLLTIKGVTLNDRIGTHAPDFLQIDGADNNYDMVIRSHGVDGGKGAIYILWDVDNYSGNKTGSKIPAITLDGSDANIKDSGLLTIKGVTTTDLIGTHAPDFLQIGGADNKYDMVIRSQVVDGSKGAIYILWDVEDYKTATITLDASVTAATSGSLTIYGAKEYDRIGTHAPDFLQLGGTDDNYDMVIGSEWVDNITGGRSSGAGKGAIYVLWDVEDYKTGPVTLNSSATGVNDAGLLTIKGAIAGKQGSQDSIAGDQIGIHETEFLQLGKENDKYDMVIRSEHVDKLPDTADTNEGAIYVLWDVADYAGGNETINLTSLSGDATSGLLTIYGREGDSKLGSSDILYRADNKDSDVDGDGTNDLVFKDKDYTYVLFGDQLGAVNADTGKVASKTIDLSQIQVDAKGFFGNDVDKELGYRFATGTGSGADGKGGYTFAEVKDVFSPPTSPPTGLSDADADLGVWDIA